jgi:hypothetical protein
VSVKDRGVGTHEQVLNVPITYRRYGPGKPSSLPSIEGGFTPTLQWLSWERNLVQTHGSVSRCAVDCVGSPFSQEQWLCPLLLTTTWKVAMRWPHEIRMMWDHTWTERGMHVVCWSGFPYKVYIDSSHDSRIWVTACLVAAIMFLNGLMACFAITTFIATLAWLSSGLSGLMFN